MLISLFISEGRGQGVAMSNLVGHVHVHIRVHPSRPMQYPIGTKDSLLVLYGYLVRCQVILVWVPCDWGRHASLVGQGHPVHPLVGIASCRGDGERGYML